ncbi:MAG: Zn-ribbon containing protein [Candidatus Micrarchaeota archaeon]
MPHKCVKCGKIYANTSKELLDGCACSSRIFLFLRDDQVTLKEAVENNLIMNNKAVAEEPVDVKKYEWLEGELSGLTKEKPVSIDYDSVENLRILEKGSYEIDVSALMKGEPLIVKNEFGVYYIKLPNKIKS